MEEKAESYVHLHVKVSGGERVLNGSHLLLAVGRGLNTNGLNAESTDMQTDRRGTLW